jgi:hypothetical protein
MSRAFSFRTLSDVARFVDVGVVGGPMGVAAATIVVLADAMRLPADHALGTSDAILDVGVR